MHYIRSPTRHPKELPQQNKRQERSVDRQTTCTAAIPPSDLQGASSQPAAAAQAGGWGKDKAPRRAAAAARAAQRRRGGRQVAAGGPRQAATSGEHRGRPAAAPR